jgi:hypothetical protein
MARLARALHARRLMAVCTPSITSATSLFTTPTNAPSSFECRPSELLFFSSMQRLPSEAKAWSRSFENPLLVSDTNRSISSAWLASPERRASSSVMRVTSVRAWGCVASEASSASSEGRRSMLPGQLPF